MIILSAELADLTAIRLGGGGDGGVVVVAVFEFDDAIAVAVDQVGELTVLLFGAAQQRCS